MLDIRELATLESARDRLDLPRQCRARPATAVGGNRIAAAGTFTRAERTPDNLADGAFTIDEAATHWTGDATVGAAPRRCGARPMMRA